MGLSSCACKYIQYSSRGRYRDRNSDHSGTPLVIECCVKVSSDVRIITWLKKSRHFYTKPKPKPEKYSTAA